MGDNVDNWFNWSKERGLPVKHMEDLIFVYGCTLVTSSAAAAFDDYAADAQVSLASRPLKNGGSSFVWSNICGTVEYHDSQLDPVCSLLVTFIHRALTFLFFSFPKRMVHTQLRIDASSSNASEQSAPCSGSNTFLGIVPSIPWKKVQLAAITRTPLTTIEKIFGTVLTILEGVLSTSLKRTLLKTIEGALLTFLEKMLLTTFGEVSLIPLKKTLLTMIEGASYKLSMFQR